MEVLVENLTFLTWQQVLMWLIGGVLIYLAIVKEMEPSLLLRDSGKPAQFRRSRGHRPPV